jgi:uncharacterized cupredoxin-like copper-binding protein
MSGDSPTPSVNDSLNYGGAPLVGPHPYANTPVRLSTLSLVPAMIASMAVVASRPLQAQAPQIVIVRATDYKFDAPDSIPSGTTSLRLENAGKEVHHLWLVQLKNGRTYDQFVKAMDSWSSATMPDWVVDVGGPNDVSPGLTASAILTLDPGHYVLVCYVPAVDGRPHVMHGMLKQLTVTTGRAEATEPTADIVVRTTDYAYEFSKPITPGTHTIRIENAAPQSHEIVIGRLAPGKTAAQALTWLNAGQHGPAPVIAIGGASGLSNGRHQTITMPFEPGRYVLLCFIPDKKDGKPHTAHGMVKEFTVGGPT